MRSAGRQVELFDGVFLNPRNKHIEKYRDGKLVSHFRAGLSPKYARRLGMADDPKTYPELPPHLAGSDHQEHAMKRNANTQPGMYRQGDVLIRRIDSLPAAAALEKNDNGRVVLAYGEVTGHAHAIAENEASSFSMASAAGVVQRFLAVASGGATLRHEEHSAIELPPGIYEIVQQREYSPEAIRNVAD